MLQQLTDSIKSLRAVPNEQDITEHFVSGHCAELAMAIYTIAMDLGGEPNLLVIYRSEMHEDEVIDTVLSHVVVELEGKRLDITGITEDGHWETMFDECDPYINTYDTWNQWSHAAIPSLNPKDAERELAGLCLNHQVPLNSASISRIVTLLETNQPFTF